MGKVSAPVKFIGKGIRKSVDLSLAPVKFARDLLVPEIPSFPAPALPPAPSGDALPPEVIEASERQILAEKRRRGRRAAILTSGAGVEDDLGSESRPRAGSINLG